MIPRIDDWRVVSDGATLVLLPATGTREGIRYLERVRPARPALDHVRCLPMPADATIIAVSEPRVLVTDEGEYATLVTVEAEHRGEPVHRVIGVVRVDDFDAITIGHVRERAAAPWIDAIVEELVRADRHYMPVRRRPFVCEPPPGWRAEPAGAYAAAWASPEGAGRITVLQALPLGGERPAAAVEALLGVSGVRTTAVPFTARGGLAGEHWTVTIGDTTVAVAVAVDDRFAYGASATGGADDGTFTDLLSTFEPIPEDRWRRRDVTPLAFWSE